MNFPPGWLAAYREVRGHGRRSTCWACRWCDERSDGEFCMRSRKEDGMPYRVVTETEPAWASYSCGPMRTFWEACDA